MKHIAQEISETLNFVKGSAYDQMQANGMGDERMLNASKSVVHRDVMIAYRTILGVLIKKNWISKCICQRNIEEYSKTPNMSKKKMDALIDVRVNCECGGTGWKDFLIIEQDKPPLKSIEKLMNPPDGNDPDDGKNNTEGEGMNS